MPTLTEITAFFTAVGVVGGLAWTVYNGRRQLASSTRSSTFGEAMQLLAVKSAEVTRLEKRLAKLERRYRRLLELYARRTHQHPDEVEMQLSNALDDEEDDDSDD